ncbi:MAG: hypothetical protein A2510_03935 [Candidatus Staskawiczbacteria bacterium RIFOXYD12_FULL_37_10]|nr:MAG: hypothetical protein A2510_03935 [Candidatus Staskawiczbacteria bacterium RIFOXYD12_FULL_37_10]
MSALNKDPKRFLSRGPYFIQITDNETCKVAKNNVKGGIIVWVKEKTYTFKWDRDAKKWV